MDEALYAELEASERTYWWFVAKRRIILALVERALVSTERGDRTLRALDIGCGTGALLEDLGERGFAASGCDTHPASLAACRARGLDVSTATLPDEIPFPDSSFDVVVLSDVLEHVEDDRGSVERIAGLLRPGGILVCTVPAHPWMWTRRDDLHHHKRRYRRIEFRSLFEIAGLEEELFGYYNSLLFPLMIGARLLSRWRGTDGRPDIEPLPRFANDLFRVTFSAERWLLGRVPLPPGGSLISVHRYAG